MSDEKAADSAIDHICRKMKSRAEPIRRTQGGNGELRSSGDLSVLTFGVSPSLALFQRQVPILRRQRCCRYGLLRTDF